MMIRSKLDGTMAGQFSIGKRGPTIRQGSLDPNSNALFGINGDIYVRIGDTPSLYQFGTGMWNIIGSASNAAPIVVESDVTTAGDQVYSIPDGYQFYKWSRNGIGQSSTSVVMTPESVTLKSSDDAQLLAGDFILLEFIPQGLPAPWYMVEYTAAQQGEQVITAPTGYKFLKWSRNGIAQRSSSVLASGVSVIVPSSQDIVAGDYLAMEFVRI